VNEWREGYFWAQPSALPPADRCGEVVAIETHAGTTTRYALAP
jgi:hypothetical protein